MTFAALGIGVGEYSLDGSTWASSSGLSSGVTYYMIASAPGILVSTGSSATTNGTYSTDGGSTWHGSLLPASDNWEGVIWAGSVFVALGQSHSAYSSDGTTWTAGGAPPLGLAQPSLALGSGTVVAIATQGATSQGIYSSNGGITWTAFTLPISQTWSQVIFASGVFVAVGGSSATAAYSSDGITWSAATLPSSGTWTGLAFGSGVFSTVQYLSNAAAYSSDGITWHAATLPSSGAWLFLTYGSSVFAAVAYNSNAAAYSSDGITWHAATLPVSDLWYKMAFGAGVFVVATYSTTNIAYSSDGITWHAATGTLSGVVSLGTGSPAATAIVMMI